MANRFKQAFAGKSVEITDAGKKKTEKDDAKIRDEKTYSYRKKYIPEYIKNSEYTMWVDTKLSDESEKSKKGVKYQSNILMTEENFKKRKTLEFKFGCKISEVPNKAISLLYDIYFYLDGANILEMDTEDIMKLVLEKAKL